MRQEVFEARYAPLWQAFEAWLDHRDRSKGGDPERVVLDDAAVPRCFRIVCQHLALARDRQYSADLVERLTQLALRGYRLLYGAEASSRNRFVEFVGGGFARTVRAERRWVVAAAVLFFGPFLGLIALLQHFPDFVYYLIDGTQIAKFEQMYNPSAVRLGREPQAESSAMMFGFYVWNNVKIGFQTFAGGLAFGAGTVFFLLFNGVLLGAVAGHLTQIGYGGAFWSFVSGHSALELTAIVLSGAAGLKLGAALVAPGLATRKSALMAASRDAARLVYGAAGMFLMAAFVEAFWSPLTELSFALKAGIGCVLWTMVLVYFIFAGRNRGA